MDVAGSVAGQGLSNRKQRKLTVTGKLACVMREAWAAMREAYG